MTVTELAWERPGLFQAIRKMHQLDLVLDSDIRDGNSSDDGLLGDPGNPFVTSKASKPLGHGFETRCCRG